MAECKKDGTLLIQRGEYSDKSTIGLFRVLITFDASKALERYWELHPQADPDDRYYTDDDGAGFVRMLIDHGYLTEMDYDVLHTGSYGRLEI